MKTIGRRETLVIAAATMIAVVLAGWFLLIKPASSKVNSLKKQGAAQQQDNNSLQTQITILRSAKKKLPQEQSELAKLAQKVPPSVQLPSLLRQMQKAAVDSGVKLNGITPTLPAPLAGADGIDAVGVTLVVAGGYSEVEAFDSALESISRAFLVSSFTLSDGAAGTSPGTATEAPVTATFIGRVLLRAPSAGTSAPTTSTLG